MPTDRFDGVADWIEHQVRRVEALADVPEKVCQPPACGLRCGGVADPAQQFLGAVGFGGGEAAGLQLFQRGSLSGGEFLRALESGPADALGQGNAACFGAAHSIDGGGEDLHDMKPIDGDRGMGKVLRRGGEKGGGHVADDFGDACRLAAMLAQEGAERGDAWLSLAGSDEQ